jgi:DNA-binding CsgD family transcriptional regulator
LAKSERSLSILVFSLFFSWLLAFPFEGQVLYAIINTYEIDAYALTFGSIAAHFIGLSTCGFFIKTMKAAKGLMLLSIVICIIGTAIFFFPPSILWQISLLLIALLSGACVAAWGFYFVKYTPSNERIKTAADVLIYSNILMIIMNVAAILLSPRLGLALSILMLGLAYYFQLKLPGEVQENIRNHTVKINKTVSPLKPLAFLCLFIVVITINSGLMYQVVNPAFSHLEWLVSWYWAVPYIVALYIMRNLSGKTNRNYILYVAIAMMGLSFIGFMMFDRSAASYLFINTLMLGACGVYDLFWWSILGEMLDFHDNPARILGIGLSANVLGVLIGGMLGSAITESDTQGINSSILALVVILIILVILPLLHKRLSTLLKNHVFLTALYEMAPAEQKVAIESFTAIDLLTARESEITALLLKGRTYKMIANELYLSENTVKTHIKNIYSKFNIKSKVELVNLMMQKEQYKNK